MGIHLELKYPSPSDLILYSFSNIAGRNIFVDTILQTIYDHVRSLPTNTASRSLFFSSINPDLCMVVNWKQPNCEFIIYSVFLYIKLFSSLDAVFFGTYCGLNMHRGSKRKHDETTIVYKDQDIRCSSLKEAVKFSKQNNLLGVICHSQIIVS
jgi:CDK inhibitor PHO81